MSKMVHTVTGPVEPANLGWCQTHEHVICDVRLAPRRENGAVAERKGFMYLQHTERAIEELKAYRQMGGGAVVEVTSSGWGRDVGRLRYISEQSGVHIVAMAGFYVEQCIPLYVDEWPIRKISELLVEELTVGVEGTGIRAGILKSAIIRARIEAVEEKALRAVCMAQRETGAAITTHTTGARRYEVRGGNHGPEHLRICLEEGVRPDRLIVGHTDERPDIRVLCELAEKGCYIQFDVLGKLHYLTEETRAYLLKQLIKEGHLNKLLIGTDRCREEELYRELGGSGYTYVHEKFLPYLRAEGITEEEIHTIMCINPGRALAF